jgi:hypothetical protein
MRNPPLMPRHKAMVPRSPIRNRKAMAAISTLVRPSRLLTCFYRLAQTAMSTASFVTKSILFTVWSRLP